MLNAPAVLVSGAGEGIGARPQDCALLSAAVPLALPVRDGTRLPGGGGGLEPRWPGPPAAPAPLEKRSNQVSVLGSTGTVNCGAKKKKVRK